MITVYPRPDSINYNLRLNRYLHKDSDGGGASAANLRGVHDYGDELIVVRMGGLF